MIKERTTTTGYMSKRRNIPTMLGQKVSSQGEEIKVVSSALDHNAIRTAQTNRNSNYSFSNHRQTTAGESSLRNNPRTNTGKGLDLGLP